ncbi:AAA family ATPase (plasmid) [Ensifer adhaerens]|uniref:AAA family ATPase n=1 Tax=Ensifer adhaerens TaxID=106592 RepID=UPI0023AA0774|nr:AAA family ATPase [Ensifer adhaerens]WDZ80807.1 AAA family ATPase [Ensifer adhaerens]
MDTDRTGSPRLEAMSGGERQAIGTRPLPAGIRFIEFFGLPGIGKTTASHLLAERLRRTGSRVDEKRMTWEDKPLVARQLNRLSLVLPRLRNHDFRSIALRTARYVAEDGQEAPADLMRWTWNLWSVAAYLAEERSKDVDVTILDQGLLQGFWSVLLKSRHRGTSEHWLDIMSAIGLDDIVFVDLRGSTDLALNRVRGRDDRASRLQREPSTGQLSLWTKAERAYCAIAADLWKTQAAARGMPMFAVVDMMASASPDEVADKTLQAVLLTYQRRHSAIEPGGQT